MRQAISYFISLALWQITSTARLKASPKAIASHNEAFVIKALIIMMREKMATITVKAFFSVKYFFISMDLHETKRLANIKSVSNFSLLPSMEWKFSSTKFCYKILNDMLG